MRVRISPRASSGHRTVRRNGTWFTPTLAIVDAWIAPAEEYMRYWPVGPAPAPEGADKLRRALDDGKQLVHGS